MVTWQPTRLAAVHKRDEMHKRSQQTCLELSNTFTIGILDMGQTEGATVDQNQTMEREFRLEPDIEGIQWEVRGALATMTLR